MKLMVSILAFAAFTTGIFAVSSAGAAEDKQLSFSELVAQHIRPNVQHPINKVQATAQTTNDVPPQVMCPGPGTGMPNPGTGTCNSQQK